MSYSLLHEAQRKASKQHRCIWCPEFIEPGARYVDERSVSDGNMQRHRWHFECREAANKFFRESGEEYFEAHEFKRGSTEAR